MLVFGPVPSRRLGKSVGVNNIPAKNCSYNCAYCQIGKTSAMKKVREPFYEPDKIINACRKRTEEIKGKNEKVDYFTLVADGEPTLDINLGEVIRGLKELGIKVAVISNASLITKNSVREDLAHADWVSLKIDAVSDDLWRRINRPLKGLDHTEILNNMLVFSKEYNGYLVTETMLVKGINDREEEFEKVSIFLTQLGPDKAYIAAPIRPPAGNISPPGVDKFNLAYQIFNSKGIKTELLIGYEGDDFFSTGSIEKDLLSIAAVHPIKKAAVKQLLNRAGAGWDSVQRLLEDEKIIKLEYRGDIFYMANIRLKR